MIRTVTTHAGDTHYTDAAQAHAISIAKALNARLRAIALWQEHGQGDAAGAETDKAGSAERKAEALAARAREEGLKASAVVREQHVLEGMLDESKSSDLLVIGLPTKAEEHGHPLVAAVMAEELPLLRKSECSVLVVSRPPRQLQNVLVNYQGGVDGKAALRIAGELAEAHKAAATVLSIHGDARQASTLTGAAANYLEGFEVLNVLERQEVGDRESAAGVILEQAASLDPDLLVLGGEPYGFWDHVLSRDTGEELALATDLPVLIAR